MKLIPIDPESLGDEYLDPKSEIVSRFRAAWQEQFPDRVMKHLVWSGDADWFVLYSVHAGANEGEVGITFLNTDDGSHVTWPFADPTLINIGITMLMLAHKSRASFVDSHFVYAHVAWAEDRPPDTLHTEAVQYVANHVGDDIEPWLASLPEMITE